MRPGIPLVTGSMPEAARVVLEHEAARAGAPQRRLGREITIRRGDTLPSTDAAPNDSGRQSRRGRTAAPAGPMRDTGVVEIVLPDRAIAVALRQPGRHMVENAALALALANEVGALRRLDDAAAGAALEATILPGRTEVLREAPLVIADGAHTRASIEALVEVLASRPPAKFVAVVSVTRGKDAAHMLRTPGTACGGGDRNRGGTLSLAPRGGAGAGSAQFGSTRPGRKHRLARRRNPRGDPPRRMRRDGLRDRIDVRGRGCAPHSPGRVIEAAFGDDTRP